MRRIIVLAFLLHCYCVSAFSQSIDKVFSKDGSVYEGYICEQIPGESVSVYAEKATLKLQNSKIRNWVENTRRGTDFACPAQIWLKDAGRDTAYVQTVSCEYDNTAYKDMLFDHRDNSATYVVSFCKTFTIPWDSILKTEKIAEESIPYGFTDVILLVTGERIEGTITKQIPGGEITMVTDNDRERIIDANDVISVRSEKKSADYSAWEQAVLLDCIETQDGTKDEGLIESRVLGKSVVFRSKIGGNTNVYPFETIVKYRKILNTDYLEYVATQDDTVSFIRVNGNTVSAIAPVVFDDVSYVVDSTMVTVHAGEKITVALKNVECDEYPHLFPLQVEKYKGSDNGEYEGKKIPCYKQSTGTLILGSISDAKDNIITIRFPMEKDGLYFLALTKELGIVIKSE